jgi:hypothetical protein
LGLLQSVRLQFQQQSQCSSISGISHIYLEDECAPFWKLLSGKGQRLPDGELPDLGDYISSASTVESTLKQQAEEARLYDIVNVLPAAMKLVRGMCSDGLK